jgi:hypothetical protein
MTIDVRIVSLGALAAHPLRGEKGDVRPGHLTTSLVSVGEQRVLIDPSLPGNLLEERLNERTGLKPTDITDVFLSSFRPLGRRGLDAFQDARWLISELERETVGVALVEGYQKAEDASDSDLAATFREEIALLQRCEAAQDVLCEGVDLFPLPGVTAGFSGMLVAHSQWTMVIASDAVPSIEHLEAGQILANAHDIEAAQESMAEVVEIADFIILGRDGLVPNPLRRW